MADSRYYLTLLAFAFYCSVLCGVTPTHGDKVVLLEEPTSKWSGWTPFKGHSWQKATRISGYGICSVGSMTEQWLLTPFISFSSSVKSFNVKFNYTVRSCASLVGSLHCNETFQLLNSEENNATTVVNLRSKQFTGLARITPDSDETVNDAPVGPAGPKSTFSGTFQRPQTSGVYFAIKIEAVCLALFSFEISYVTCSSQGVNLVKFKETASPQTGSPGINVNGTCVNHAVPSPGSSSLYATCDNSGEWTAGVNVSCVCTAGYQQNVQLNTCEATKPTPSLVHQPPSSATVLIRNSTDALSGKKLSELFEGPVSTSGMAVVRTVSITPNSTVKTYSATIPSPRPTTYSATVPSPRPTTYSATVPSPRPTTSPPRDLIFVKIEIRLDLKFIPEYFTKERKEYKELAAAISKALEQVYRTLNGFFRVEIIAFREGSVICDFILIMRSDADAGRKQLKEMLQEASNSGKFADFKITKIHVEESKKIEIKEKLFQWSLITIIILACICGLLLPTVILLAISLYKAKNKQSSPYTYVAEDNLDIPLNQLNRNVEDQLRMVETTIQAKSATPDFYGSKDYMN